MAPQQNPTDTVAPYLVVTEKKGTKHIQVDLPMAGYESGDVIVRPDDTRLLIMDKSEVVMRTVQLPFSVDPYTVEAEIKDGWLKIESPIAC